MKINLEFIEKSLEELFPDAHCSLDFHNPFECLIAVILSAQSTDKGVNKVTPALFKDYPDAKSLAKAKVEDIYPYLKPLGLYKNKSQNIVKLAQIIVGQYGGEVPLDFKTLLSLPGVGKKTAGVVLLQIANRPAIPVDTHIRRVSNRLGLVKNLEDPDKIEERLEKLFPVSSYKAMHHRLIYFGREICKASKPLCEECPFRENCVYLKKAKSTASKKS